MYMSRLPYADAFAIIPAHSMHTAMRWQAVVIRDGWFGFAPCSSRATPGECLADIGRLTRRYTEGEFFRALGSMNDGIGAGVSASFKAHVGEMLDNGLNVLEREIGDVTSGAKRPKILKPILPKKFRPRVAVPADKDWLFG